MSTYTSHQNIKETEAAITHGDCMGIERPHAILAVVLQSDFVC